MMAARSKTKIATIDQYLSSVTDEQREALQKLRKAILAAAPRAQECISYSLPAFRLDGKLLVAFGASPNHCSFFPMSGSIVERHKDLLRSYETSKGTIRFPPGKPLPATLVRTIVKAKIAENSR